MAAELLAPYFRATDDKGKVISDATLEFFESGTNNPIEVFKDHDLSQAHSRPVVADRGGLFPPIYIDAEKKHRIVLRDDPTKPPVIEVDPLNATLLTNLIAALAAPDGASRIGFQQPLSGTVSRNLQSKVSDFISVKDFGARGDGLTDDSNAIQNAIERLSADGGGELHFPPGDYRLTQTLRIKKRVTLVGSGYNSDDARNLVTRLNFEDSHTATKEACILVDRPSDEVAFFGARNLMFKCPGSEWETILKLVESHWATIENCYFTGAPLKAAIWLGATLYTNVSSSIFSLQNGCAIDARQSNLPVTYYGTNWSQFVRNKFFVAKEALVATGIFTFSQNTIESGQSACQAKIVVEGPQISQPRIVENYLEISDTTDSSEPCRFFLIDDTTGGQVVSGTVSRNSLYSSPRKVGSVAIDLNFRPFQGAIENNLISHFEFGLNHGSSASRFTFKDNTAIGEVIAWKGGYYDYGWPGGGNADYGSLTLADPNSQDLGYYQTVIRSMWQNPTGQSPELFLKRGCNIAVETNGATIDRIRDAGLYPGAIVTLHAHNSFDLKHLAATGLYVLQITDGGDAPYTDPEIRIVGGGGNGVGFGSPKIYAGSIRSVEIINPGQGFTSTPTVQISDPTGSGSGAEAVAIREASFRLKKGSDCTIPAGCAIQFIVGINRELIEIGDFSARH